MAVITDIVSRLSWFRVKEPRSRQPGTAISTFLQGSNFADGTRAAWRNQRQENHGRRVYFTS